MCSKIELALWNPSNKTRNQGLLLRELKLSTTLLYTHPLPHGRTRLERLGHPLVSKAKF